MKIYTLIVMLVCLYIDLHGQITIINNTNKDFTNLYIIDYDSTIKTTGTCEMITEKNLLKKRLDSKKQTIISLKVFPTKYYNIICLDTTEFSNSYNSLALKYYLTGKSKQIIIDSSNIEKDFWGHCTEGMADQDFEDFNIHVNNKNDNNVIKIYFKFGESNKFIRYMDLNQWKPIAKNSVKQMTIYNSKPKNTELLFLKYFIEEKGIITEHVIHDSIKKDQQVFNLEIE